MLRSPLIALAILFSLLSPAHAATLTGKVVHVPDGDTIVVQIDPSRKEKVRLLGIDCPEVAHGPGDPGQEPWGTRARAFTEGLVLGKTVRLETDVQSRDRYKRLLAYVYVGSTFVNLELIKHGHAMLLTYPPNVAHVDSFTAAQKAAREHGAGIWNPSDRMRQTPHEYRHHGEAELQREFAGKIIGNKNSLKYHRATCPLAAKMSEYNRLILSSPEAARSEGYSPCRRCAI